MDPIAEMPTTEWINLTPDLAREFLKTTPEHQRKVSHPVVDKYAAAMARGEWRLTGEPITFDVNDALIQGRHRCMAVVQSGVTIPMLVVRGAPEDSFAVIDVGRVRNAGQFIPGQYQHTVVAAARLLWAVENNVLASIQYKTWRSWPIDVQIRYVETWPELSDPELDLVRLCASAGRMSSVGTKFLLAVAAQVMRTEHRELINPFMNGVQKMNAPDLRPNDPRMELIRKFRNARLGYNSVVGLQDQGYSIVVKAWNAYVLGQEANKQTLTVKPGRDRRAVVVGSPIDSRKSPIVPVVNSPVMDDVA